MTQGMDMTRDDRHENDQYGSHGDAGGRIVARGVEERPVRRESRLLLAALVTTGTMLAEAVGGVVSGSLALLADAGHMLVDASALALAWIGARIARRPADARRSYGYGRVEVLAGFVNALTMFLLAGWILWEAIERIRAPGPILDGVMLVVAVSGLLANLLVLKVLGGVHGHAHAGGHTHLHAHAHGDRAHLHVHDGGRARGHGLAPAGGPVREGGHAIAGANRRAHAHGVTHARGDADVNLQGARLHVIGDLLGSLAAVAAALIVRWTGWTIADPILSALVALLIIASATSLLKRCAHILLEGTPEGLDLDEMATSLAASHASIRGVHHIHVWSLASGERMATLHVDLANPAEGQPAANAVRAMLLDRYGVGHATIQLDSGDDCPDTGCRHA